MDLGRVGYTKLGDCRDITNCDMLEPQVFQTGLPVDLTLQDSLRY